MSFLGAVLCELTEYARLLDRNRRGKSLILIISALPPISWGTKQDGTIEADLGAVIQDSHSQADVEVQVDTN